jgi:hypothetical protein
MLSIGPCWIVIRLRTQTPSLARRKPLSGLLSLLSVRGSRTAPNVTLLLSPFVLNVQPVAPDLTGVNISEPIYKSALVDDGEGLWSREAAICLLPKRFDTTKTHCRPYVTRNGIGPSCGSVPTMYYGHMRPGLQGAQRNSPAGGPAREPWR